MTKIFILLLMSDSFLCHLWLSLFIHSNPKVELASKCSDNKGRYIIYWGGGGGEEGRVISEILESWGRVEAFKSLKVRGGLCFEIQKT